MIQQILLIITFSAVSFISARTLYLQPLKNGEPNIYQEKYLRLQRQIQQIHSVDFEEYMQLKEQKEKYLKADEILGKIFLVFLAEVGLKLSKKELQHLKSQGVSIPEPAPVALNDGPPCPPVSSQQGFVPRDDMSWLRYEKLQGANKLSEDDAKSLEIKDLFGVLKKAKAMGVAEAQRLDGTFEGTITPDKEGNPWNIQMVMEISGLNPQGHVDGQYKLALSELGKEPFSTSNGDWSPEGFLHTEGSQAMFIKLRAKGKEGYMHLYLVDGNTKLIGNYYEPVSLDQYNKVGTVAMVRR